MIPLSQMMPGQTGRIVKLTTSNRRVLRKLMALGILPGAIVAVIRCSPAYVFQLEQSQFTVDREIAEGITVEVDEMKEAVIQEGLDEEKGFGNRFRWRRRKRR